MLEAVSHPQLCALLFFPAQKKGPQAVAIPFDFIRCTLRSSEAQPHSEAEESFIHAFAASSLRRVENGIASQAADCTVGI